MRRVFSASSGLICSELQALEIEQSVDVDETGEGIPVEVLMALSALGRKHGVLCAFVGAGAACSQSVGIPEALPVVCSSDTILSSLASSWAVLEVDERPFRFRTVGDGRQSFFKR